MLSRSTYGTDRKIERRRTWHYVLDVVQLLPVLLGREAARAEEEQEGSPQRGEHTQPAEDEAPVVRDLRVLLQDLINDRD